MSKDTEKAFTMLPESNDTTFCVRVTGIVTAEDYQDYIYKPVSVMKHGDKPFRILVVVEEGFLGLTEDAAKADLMFRMENDGLDSERVALVTYNPAHKEKLLSIESFMKQGEFKAFDDRLDDAMEWIFED